MSALRLLRPIPTARRYYSSFFSNKPGGGRYFNSHKPAKPVVTAPKENDASADSSSSSSSSSPNSASTVKPDDAPTPSPPRSATLVPLDASAVRQPEGLPPHPVIAPKDFQLHQFFSVHRPLLLLSDPPSIFNSPPPGAPLFPSLAVPRYEWHSELPDEVTGPRQSDSTDGNTPVDPDMVLARQITHALTMVRAGSTISWESTLRRLGVDVDSAAHDLQATECNQEWEDILADSVKRKRRKKMKKHKLRKRRKLTRASRLKLK